MMRHIGVLASKSTAFIQKVKTKPRMYNALELAAVPRFAFNNFRKSSSSNNNFPSGLNDSLPGLETEPSPTGLACFSS